ncbi:hypothetical protein ES288_A07G258700v1 [Gossypium darwinii]|uniref:Uncharacterized protein n=1 Tax=Gossypium darwinii TaxID=34276 RepID=A0A5D2G203_GOSDA|nr:hypothetical protein ES288_A07G258700v1 [Gossypium darwinii]
MVKCSLEQLKKAKTMATIAAWQSSKTALSLSSNSSLGQRLSIPPPLSPLHRRIVKCGALLLWICSRNHLGSWGWDCIYGGSVLEGDPRLYSGSLAAYYLICVVMT